MCETMISFLDGNQLFLILVGGVMQLTQDRKHVNRMSENGKFGPKILFLE
jgi:hypothetical protein